MKSVQNFSEKGKKKWFFFKNLICKKIYGQARSPTDKTPGSKGNPI
jgi:hypothetical protein